MATNRNRKRRPAPKTADGNLARKIDRGEEERRRKEERLREIERQRYYREQQREEEEERRARQRAAAKARAAVRAAQRVSPVLIAGFAVTVGLMVLVLLCYVQLNTISRHIVEMKEQIKQMEVQQVSLLTRYEQTFDLTSVKEAAEAAGMTQPSESQMYYIDLPGEDQAVSYGDTDLGPVERLAGKVREIIREIKEYFQQQEVYS